MKRYFKARDLYTKAMARLFHKFFVAIQCEAAKTYTNNPIAFKGDEHAL
jgi:hypothetical protein